MLSPGVPGDPEIWVHPEEFSVLGRGEADNRIRLRCTAKGVETIRPGAFYLVRHLRQRRGAAFFVQDSRHITLQNNCVYSTWGMTHMVNGQSSHILFDGEIIRIRPGSRRHISTDGDGIHIIRSQGYLQIQNCDFSGMGDDDVNIHDCNMLILRRLGSHTLLLENEGAGDPGDRLELLNKDFSPSGVSLTLRAVTQQEDGRYCLEIEEELPDWIEEGHLLLNRHYASDHFCHPQQLFSRSPRPGAGSSRPRRAWWKTTSSAAPRERVSTLCWKPCGDSGTREPARDSW